jgi:Flp pilus assembly protein TadG
MKGQSLVELAICLPVVLALGLGAVVVVRAVDGATGLQAATEAAVRAAARSVDVSEAASAAQSRFSFVVAAYPVRSPSLELQLGDFTRGATITATASGWSDSIALHAEARAVIELWRSRP